MKQNLKQLLAEADSLIKDTQIKIKDISNDVAFLKQNQKGFVNGLIGQKISESIEFSTGYPTFYLPGEPSGMKLKEIKETYH